MGDVITMQVEDYLVTHRVVEVSPDGSFVTQGDANSTRDDWSGVPVHVVGRVWFHLPAVGRLLSALGSQAFFTDQAAVAGTASAASEFELPESDAELISPATDEERVAE